MHTSPTCIRGVPMMFFERIWLATRHPWIPSFSVFPSSCLLLFSQFGVIRLLTSLSFASVKRKEVPARGTSGNDGTATTFGDDRRRKTISVNSGCSSVEHLSRGTVFRRFPWQDPEASSYSENVLPSTMYHLSNSLSSSLSSSLSIPIFQLTL